MEVMDAHFGRATCCTVIKSVADNLPNDARVHEAKGSKKISSDFMDARVNVVILPSRAIVSRRSGRTRQREWVPGITLAHEISHELGPNYSRTATVKRYS